MFPMTTALWLNICLWISVSFPVSWFAQLWQSFKIFSILMNEAHRAFLSGERIVSKLLRRHKMTALKLYSFLPSPNFSTACVFKIWFPWRKYEHKTIVDLHFFSHLHCHLFNLFIVFKFYSTMFPFHVLLSCS